MRRIVIWAMSTLSVLVLLFSYNTSRTSTAIATAEVRPAATSTKSATSGSSAASSGDSTTQEPSTSSGTGSAASDSSSTPTPSDSATSGSSAGSASKTYDGDAIMTRYGPVQVQITVSSGKITASDVLQVPMSDRRDQMINSQAVPVYNDETVQAQSASIDVVSGATYTWEGYTQSLQSAIDQANI